MIDVFSRGREAVDPVPFSRRRFLAKSSYFGAMYAAAKLLPMPALAVELAEDPRISQTLIVEIDSHGHRVQQIEAVAGVPEKNKQAVLQKGAPIRTQSQAVNDGCKRGR